MRMLGIILIVVGIAMLLFRGFSYTQDKKVVDAGPIQIDRKENKTVEWPMYAGVVAVVAGIAVFAMSKKESV